MLYKCMLHGFNNITQTRSIDICRAMKYVSKFISVIDKCRENIDIILEKWYKETLELGLQIDVPEPRLPRINKIQVYKEYIPASTPQIYYHLVITIFIDR